MFSKVLTVVVVLCAVQVFGGSIKPKLSAEIQEVVTDIDIASLLIENELKKVTAGQKHELDLVKINTKMALKQLKTVIKGSKGTLCGAMAQLQSKEIEMRADDVKECNNKVNTKELQRDLHAYLKNLHDEAMMVDRYCGFVNAEVEAIAQCVQLGAANMKTKLDDVESVIGGSLANHLNTNSQCINSVVDDVQLGSARIQLELADCLNPTTTKEPATTEDLSSESKNSEESNESGSGSNSEETSGEVSEAPVKETSEADDEGENNSSVGSDTDEQTSEQTPEGGNNGEEGNDVPTAPEDNENKEEVPAENNQEGETANSTQAPAENSSVEENPKAPVEDNQEEQAPSESNVAEDAPVEVASSEKVPVDESPIVETKEEDTKSVEDADEINIEY